jgi:hypothetical protein
MGGLQNTLPVFLSEKGNQVIKEYKKFSMWRWKKAVFDVHINFLLRIIIYKNSLLISRMDPHCFDADPEQDPDPAQNLDADPDSDPEPGGGGGGGRG